MDLDQSEINDLSMASGLPLEACDIDIKGYRGNGVRIVVSVPNTGLRVAVTRTLASIEAVAVPELSAGPLVRSVRRFAMDSPEEWARVIMDVESRGVKVVVTVNEQLLDSPTDLPDYDWWSFWVECRKRISGDFAASSWPVLLEVTASALAISLAGVASANDGPESDEFYGAFEGGRYLHQEQRYERHPANRMRCIAHYGARCWVCELDFREQYGEVGDGFIEVHHRVPLASFDGPIWVDPVCDLVPLCSNCHAMVHRRKPPYEPSELRLLAGLAEKHPSLPPRPTNLLAGSSSD